MTGAHETTDLVGAFSALQSVMLSAQGVDDFLGEVTRVAARAVSPPAACGITVRLEGRPLTVASSDEVARQLDSAQYEEGDGPCLETVDTGEVRDVPDVAAADRWPVFRDRAVALGLGSSLSLPLTADGRTLGGLNFYGKGRDAFTGPVRQHVEVFAAQATTALLLVLRSAGHAEQRAQLEQALASRTVIDQALGILMAQQKCTAEEAFALLRTHSQNNNRKLRDVAVDLIVRVSGRPPVPGRGFER
jgi:GAF domain-containing protein